MDIVELLKLMKAESSIVIVQHVFHNGIMMMIVNVNSVFQTLRLNLPKMNVKGD